MTRCYITCKHTIEKLKFSGRFLIFSTTNKEKIICLEKNVFSVWHVWTCSLTEIFFFFTQFHSFYRQKKICEDFKKNKEFRSWRKILTKNVQINKKKNPGKNIFLKKIFFTQWKNILEKIPCSWFDTWKKHSKTNKKININSLSFTRFLRGRN